MGEIIRTAELVRLVEQWNAITGRTDDDMSARADILHRLINCRNDWVAAYNVARFTGYLSGLESVHLFVRMLQSEAERQTS